MEDVVGPFKPCDAPKSGVYIGRNPKLKGKTALVGTAWFGGMPLAQFDDEDTGYAYGWWPFGATDFEIQRT